MLKRNFKDNKYVQKLKRLRLLRMKMKMKKRIMKMRILKYKMKIRRVMPLIMKIRPGALKKMKNKRQRINYEILFK